MTWKKIINTGSIVSSLTFVSATISSLAVTSTNLNHSDLGGLHQSVITTASPELKALTLSGVSSGNALQVFGGVADYTSQFVGVNQYGALYSGLRTDTADETAYSVLATSGDTYSRIGFGLWNGVPFFGFGPGGASKRDFWLFRRAGDLTFETGTTPVEKVRITSGGNIVVNPGFLHIGSDAAVYGVTDRFAITTFGVNDSGTIALQMVNRTSVCGARTRFVTGNATASNPYFALEVREGTGSLNIVERMRIKDTVMTIQTDIQPMTDNTYYLGKNSISTPLAWKGIIVKDQAGTGKYYRLEVYNDTLRIVEIT